MGKLSSRSDGMTHGERKFERRKQFIEFVKLSSALKVINKEKQRHVLSQRKRRRHSKLGAYNLSSLLECLPDYKDSSEPRPVPYDFDLNKPPPRFKLDSKTRKNLLLKEGNQLKMVISHPVFQSDPLGSVYQHLKSTQPVVEEKSKRNDCKNGKKKRSQGSSQQSMEF